MKVKELIDKEKTLRLSLQLEEHPFDRDKKFKEYEEFISSEVELK